VRRVRGPASHWFPTAPDPTVGGWYGPRMCRPLTPGERAVWLPYTGRVATAEVVRSPPPHYRRSPKAVRGNPKPPFPLPPPLSRHSRVMMTSYPKPPPPHHVALHAVLPPPYPSTVSRHVCMPMPTWCLRVPSSQRPRHLPCHVNITCRVIRLYPGLTGDIMLTSSRERAKASFVQIFVFKAPVPI